MPVEDLIPLTPTVPAKPTACNMYLVNSIKLGAANNATAVTKLQTFLNTYEQEALVVDGTYDADDDAAVKRFQAKYATEILAPWGATEPTGYVFTTTRAKINAIYCANQPTEFIPETPENTQVLLQQIIAVLQQRAADAKANGEEVSKEMETLLNRLEELGL